jgi:hypothetical protein
VTVPFRIAAKQAPAAKAKQSAMIGSDELEVFTYYFPFQMADPKQRASVRAYLAQRNTGIPLPEVQVINIFGQPTEGTFTLKVGRKTTSPLELDAPAEKVQEELQGLRAAGTPTVTGSAATGYVVTFPDTGKVAPEITATWSFTYDKGPEPGVTISTPPGVFFLIDLDGVPLTLPEDDALPFILGVVLAKRGLEAARRVSYRPEMLPAAKG